VHQGGDGGHGREKLPEQFHALTTNIGREDREPSNVPPRVGEARDQACANGITREHDDRDDRGRALRRMGGWRVGCHDEIHLKTHELGGKFVETLDLSRRRPAIVDVDVLPLGIPQLAQSLTERLIEPFRRRNG